MRGLHIVEHYIKLGAKERTLLLNLSSILWRLDIEHIDNHFPSRLHIGTSIQKEP